MSRWFGTVAVFLFVAVLGAVPTKAQAQATGTPPCQMELPLIKSQMNVTGSYPGVCVDGHYNGAATFRIDDPTDPQFIPMEYTVNVKDGKVFGTSILSIGEGAITFTGTLRQYHPWNGTNIAYDEHNNPVRDAVRNGQPVPYDPSLATSAFVPFVPNIKVPSTPSAVPSINRCQADRPTDRYFVTGSFDGECENGRFTGTATLTLSPKDPHDPVIKLVARYQDGKLNGPVTATYPQYALRYRGSFEGFRVGTGRAEQPLGGRNFDITDYVDGQVVSHRTEYRPPSEFEQQLIAAAGRLGEHLGTQLGREIDGSAERARVAKREAEAAREQEVRRLAEQQARQERGASQRLALAETNAGVGEGQRGTQPSGPTTSNTSDYPPMGSSPTNQTQLPCYACAPKQTQSASPPCYACAPQQSQGSAPPPCYACPPSSQQSFAPAQASSSGGAYPPMAWGGSSTGSGSQSQTWSQTGDQSAPASPAPMQTWSATSGASSTNQVQSSPPVLTTADQGPPPPTVGTNPPQQEMQPPSQLPEPFSGPVPVQSAGLKPPEPTQAGSSVPSQAPIATEQAEGFKSPTYVNNPQPTQTGASQSGILGSGSGAASQPMARQVATVPSVPTGLYPTNQGELAQPIPLGWQPVPGATRYRITVKDQNTGGFPVDDVYTTQNPYSVGNLPAGHFFTWDVAACNQAGCSGRSGNGAFRTGGGSIAGVTSQCGQLTRYQQAIVDGYYGLDQQVGVSKPTQTTLCRWQQDGSLERRLALYQAEISAVANSGPNAPPSVRHRLAVTRVMNSPQLRSMITGLAVSVASDLMQMKTKNKWAVTSGNLADIWFNDLGNIYNIYKRDKSNPNWTDKAILMKMIYDYFYRKIYTENGIPGAKYIPSITDIAGDASYEYLESYLSGQ